MIKSIELKNVQSHECTRVEFDKGINCIVGSSNNGKSAILRGLYWVKYNRPLGVDSLASHWALNEKGELKDSMSVTVENDNGSVTRRRTKSENQYIVNDEVLNVVKSDVPDSVEKTLRLSDTNIQRQMDAPFLLSSTSGEVAKYFNRIVRLDIIDRVLANAESIRRKTRAEIERAEGQIKGCETELESFRWLDSAELTLNKYERAEKKNSELRKKLEGLKKTFGEYEALIDVVNKCDLTDAKKIVARIECMHSDNLHLAEKIRDVVSDVERVENARVYPDFDDEKVLIVELLDYNPNWGSIERLNHELTMYERGKMMVEDNCNEAGRLRAQMPDICPLCNRPMNECDGEA